MVQSPTVSIVVTVFNKERYLPDTIRSFLNQTEDQADVEYVFADDSSTDRSLDVIREHLKNAPHVQIIENTENRGTSIRLNQAAQAARGRFLYFFDSDDIATRGAMQGMLQRLRAHDADFIYGKTVKNADPTTLFDLEADPDAPHEASDQPLAMILRGGFVNMALMCKRDLFAEAGGCDERVFVQDESLPLRLARKARRMVAWQAYVLAQPAPDEAVDRFSSNKAQLHHDAFFACYNALEELEERHQDLAPNLYARAVSNYWKHVRRQPGPAVLHPGFWRYLQTKLSHPRPNADVLAAMAAEFAALPGIRRTNV